MHNPASALHSPSDHLKCRAMSHSICNALPQQATRACAVQMERTRAEWKDERERLQAAVADAKLQASQRLTDLTEHYGRQACQWHASHPASACCSALLLSIACTPS